MAYDYKTQRKNLFTEEGSVLFLAYRDQANRLLDEAGAFMSGKITLSGDAWDAIACADRLVELGEIREMSSPGAWGQHRVFVRVRK